MVEFIGKPLGGWTVLDVDRIGSNRLRALAAHCARKAGDMAHVDATMTPLNRRLLGPPEGPETAVKDYLARTGAKIDKRNEQPFTALVLGASPEWFRPDRPNERGAWDEDRLEEWLGLAWQWAQEEFGDSLVYAELHLDETTPHLHALVVPTVTRKGKRGTKQVSHHLFPSFNGPKSYSRLLDRYAAALAPLDIERGREASEGGTSPTTKAQWAADLVRQAKAANEEARELRAALEIGAEAVLANRLHYRVRKDGSGTLAKGEAFPRNPELGRRLVEHIRPAWSVVVRFAAQYARAAERIGIEWAKIEDERRKLDRERDMQGEWATSLSAREAAVGGVETLRATEQARRLSIRAFGRGEAI